MTERSSSRTRPALDREQVVRAALHLLDDVGLDDLTMRRLADRLGVTVASLYWHVRDKHELLALLGEAISAEMPLPRQDVPWREALTQGARDYRRALLAHRDGARILSATPPVGAHRLRATEVLLTMLRHAGLSLQDVADVGYLFNTFIVGYVLDETQSAVEPLPAPGSSEARSVPLLVNLAGGHVQVREGAVNLTVRCDATLTDLYRAVSDGRSPEIEERDGAISFKQRHSRRDSCTLTLTGAIPWEIDIQGGASRFSADLSQGRLTALAISGGVSDCRMHLSAPVGRVPLHIDGGVNQLLCERAAGAALRVSLKRGGSKLMLDGLHLGSVGGDMRWESPGFAAALDYYDLQVTGGTRELTISTLSGGTEGDGRPDGVAHDWTVQGVFGSRPEEYPTLAVLAPYFTNADSDRRFDVGLQILLDGLDQRLAHSRENGEIGPRAVPSR